MDWGYIYPREHGSFFNSPGASFSPVRPRHNVWPKSPPSDISWHRIVKHNLSSPRPGDLGIIGWCGLFIALLTSNLICIATPTSCLNNFNQNLIRAGWLLWRCEIQNFGNNKQRKKKATKVVSPSVPGPPFFQDVGIYTAITGVHSISEFYKYTTHFKLKYLHLHHR